MTTQLENQKSKIENPPHLNPYAPLAYTPSTRKLKVLLISHTCQSLTEGQPKAHALATLPDIDLHLLTPNHWLHYGSWRNAQPPVHPDPTSPKFQTTIAPIRFAALGPAQSFLHYYPTLPSILQKFQPDIIDLWEEPWSHVSAHACRLRNRLLPSAKIVSETEQNIFKNLPFPFEHFRTFTLKNADAAIARSPEALQVLRQKSYQGPAHVIPNAVDTNLFRPLNRTACRQQLCAMLTEGPSNPHPLLLQIENQNSKIENPFLAAYIGRLVPEKGLLDLLHSLPLAAKNTHLLFVGDGPLLPHLRTLAAHLQVAHRTHFLPNQPLENLPTIMNAIDTLVLPSLTTKSWKEQFGRVLIEAGACQTPVIGSTSGAIPDVIADAGLLVPEHDPAALAAALTTLATNPTLAHTLAQKAHHNATTLFTWQTVATSMASLYHSLV